MKKTKFPEKRDCVMHENRKCKGLNELLCVTKGICKFYKTQEMIDADMQKIRSRNPDYDQRGGAW